MLWVINYLLSITGLFPSLYLHLYLISYCNFLYLLLSHSLFIIFFLFYVPLVSVLLSPNLCHSPLFLSASFSHSYPPLSLLLSPSFTPSASFPSPCSNIKRLLAVPLIDHLWQPISSQASSYSLWGNLKIILVGVPSVPTPSPQIWTSSSCGRIESTIQMHDMNTIQKSPFTW